METLKKTLYIPANHHLQLDIQLPQSFPTGEAEVLLIFAAKAKTQGNAYHDLLQLAGQLKNSACFDADPVTLQRNLRDEWQS